MNKIVPLFVFIVLMLFPESVYAVPFSFNIDTVSATTISSGSQEINVSLSITNLPSESYFRVALQKESGGSYFGYLMNNNGDWASVQPLSGDCSIYYKISDTSTTSLALRFKIGEDAIVDNGNYKLKAHRFTKTCTSYTEAVNFNNFTINIPAPTPTSSPVQPSNSPATTPTPTILNVIKNTPSPSPQKTLNATNSPSPSPEVLGEKESTKSQEATISTKSNQPSPILKAENTSSSKNLSLILMGSGTVIILISLSIYLFLKRKTKRYQDFNDNKNISEND